MAPRLQERVDPAPADLSEAPHPLRDAVAAAARAGVSGRLAAAGQINRLLRSIQPGPNAGADSAVILEALEKGSLNGLADGTQTSCRVQAIEALLRLGYPWALGIHPSDLDFYRAGSRAWPRWLKLALTAALTALVAGGGALGFLLWPGTAVAPPAATASVPIQHVALTRPERAPRELIVGDTAATSSASTYLRPDGVIAAQIEVRAARAPNAARPELEVRSLGMYLEETGTLVQSFRGLAMPTIEDPAGERSLVLDVPIEVESGRRYFFVLDLSLNRMPLRSLRTGSISPQFPVDAPAVTVDAFPVLREPLSAPEMERTRVQVAVDSSGDVLEATPLGGRAGPEVDRLLETIKAAKFAPALRDGLPVAATVIVTHPAVPAGSTETQVEDSLAPLDESRLAAERARRFTERLEGIELIMSRDPAKKAAFAAEVEAVQANLKAARTLRDLSLAEDELTSLAQRFYER